MPKYESLGDNGWLCEIEEFFLWKKVNTSLGNPPTSELLIR